MAYSTRFTPPKTALATVFEPKTKVSELQPLQIPRAAANGHSVLLPSPPQAQLLPSATELRIPPAEQWCLLGGRADFWMFFPSGILCKYTNTEMPGNTQTEELRVQYYKVFFIGERANCQRQFACLGSSELWDDLNQHRSGPSKG